LAHGMMLAECRREVNGIACGSAGLWPPENHMMSANLYSGRSSSQRTGAAANSRFSNEATSQANREPDGDFRIRDPQLSCRRSLHASVVTFGREVDTELDVFLEQ
jgi:hypothetical protein